ncbi:hypothetical protein A8U91_00482 [Halomonas elongata]|uniref:Uncharacterized protein n=1 Tax=Halomonas elongata TaxID=2746 RepID=A0A1B8P1I6_HALEL|nr:hypothetical protein [Halomonas elongata]OBX36145.1 hypothetical protein A8U91_00482 [Halomonas elongata]
MTDAITNDQNQPVTGTTLGKKRSRLADGARQNADGLGVGLPVVLSWMLSTFAGVEISIEHRRCGPWLDWTRSSRRCELRVSNHRIALN